MPLARDALNELYRAPINLWVEDELTCAYLDTLWDDPGVAFLIGGGREGVRAVVKTAEASGFANVFGLIDRDFGPTNAREWGDPGRNFRVFVMTRHEVENYLLDTSSLVGCRFNTHPRSPQEIDALLLAEAERRCWWDACRRVVGVIRDRVFEGFLEHPTTPPVETEEAARSHIVASDWFRALPSKASEMTEAWVDRHLKEYHCRAEASLDDGTWRVDFSGKEFAREIGNRIYSRATAPRSYRPTTSQFDVDLAVAIAEWQVANGAIPDDLAGLLAALKARVAR